MKEANLLKVKFGSFVKLCTIIFLSLGIIIGVFGFLGSLLGANVYAQIGSFYITGVKAGMLNLFLFPLFFSVSGVLIGILAFLPFKFFLNKNKGLKLNVELKD